MKERRRHSIVPGIVLSFLCAAAAGQAPSTGQTPEARIEHLQKMLAQSPGNGGVMYQLAVACARAGQNDRAIRWLEKATALGSDLDLTHESAFAPLRKFESFRELARPSAHPPVHTSTLAFRIPEPDLIPEGIAWDPVGKTFYVGSLYKKKIVHVGPGATIGDFIRSGRDGLWMVLGMAVDAPRRILWVNSAADGREGEASGSSGLFAFDLSDSRLLEKHVLDGRREKHIFNDLAVTPEGDVYLTDSGSGAVYRLARGGRDLEIFLAPGSFTYPNGIAFDPGKRRLYVADFSTGISIVDLEKKAHRPLPHPRDVTLYGVDGLYFVRQSLVAIQNGPGMERVVQFRLERSGERVGSARVIESRNPDFQIPTTGAVVGSDFFYLANTQLETLGEDGKLAPDASLQDILIFKAPIP